MENDKQKVSIIIATFNRDNLIKRAIDSVFLQNYPNFEIIVVDDCSVDKTGEIVNGYNDSRIIYIRNESNYGVAKSRNIGIGNSTGEFISFLDSDDEWLPGKLVSELKLLEENPDCAAVSFDQIFINEKNKKNFNRQILFKQNPSHSQLISREDVLRGKSLSTNDFTIRKNIIKKIKGFDENFPSREDWDIWIRITEVSSVIQSSIIMTKKYIFHGYQLSTDINKKIKGTVAILNKYKNLFLSDSTAFFRIYLIIIVLFIFKNEPISAKLYLEESIKSLKDKRKKFVLRSILLIIKVFGFSGTRFLNIIFKILNPNSYLLWVNQ